MSALAGNPQRNKVPRMGNTVAILGDSFDVRSKPTQSFQSLQYSSLGIWQWINAFLMQRMNIVNINAVNGSGAISVGTAGSGGEAVAGTYASRIQAAVYDFNPAWAAIRASVNDFGGSNTFDQIRDAYTALFEGCAQRGIKIITNTVGPGTTTTMDTAAKRSVWKRFNEWITMVAPQTWDMVVLAQHYQYLNPANTNGQALGGTDLHPTHSYAVKIAYDSAQQLEPIFRKFPSPVAVLAATGDGSSGSIDSNSLNKGSGGGKTTITGNGIDGFTTSISGGSGTATQVARTDGAGYWNEIDWTPDQAGRNFQLYQSNIALPAGLAIGDVVKCLCEFECDSASVSCSEGVRVTVVFTGSGSPALDITGMAQGGYTATSLRGWRAVFATPALAIPANTTGIQITYYVFSTTNTQHKFRIGQHGLIKLSALGLSS